jgi:hypothetical protein
LKTVRVSAPSGTTLAENKDEAQELRDEIILPALEAGETVEIDFSAVDSATQSYIHVLVADAVRKYGDEIYGRLHFVQPSPGILSLIETVFEYTMLASREAEGADVPVDAT